VAPDLAVKMAIATSMATIIFTSVSSVRAHHKRGAVRWDIVKRWPPASCWAQRWPAWACLPCSRALGWRCFLRLSSASRPPRCCWTKNPSPPHPAGTAGQLGAGGVIGFLSGLVGAGGGFVSVPFMTWCNVAIHNAVATSAALGFPIALANALGYVVAGQGVAGLPAGSWATFTCPPWR
jgi:uncharacterized protein